CRLPSRYTPISMGMRRSVRWKGKIWPRGEFIRVRSSQARRNAREILNAAAAMFHAVESAVSGGEKLFGRVAVFGYGRGAGVGGQSGRFRLGGHFFVNAVDDSHRDIQPGFGKYNGEFVSAVARRCVDRAAMIAEDFAKADERAAACQMPVAVVYGLE